MAEKKKKIEPKEVDEFIKDLKMLVDMGGIRVEPEEDPNKEMAKFMITMVRSFIDVGFSREEAFELLMLIVTSSINGIGR